MFEIYNFGSGSGGNSTLVSDGKTQILIDLGLTLTRIKSGIKEAGYSIGDIAAVLVTHLHTDHFKPMLLNTFKPSLIFGSFFLKDNPDINLVFPFESFRVGTLNITPLQASHDDVNVENTVGFRVENDLGEVLVYLTDTGFVPEENMELMKNADIYMIESNHDLHILHNESSYPPLTIERIDSDVGHLSNFDAAIATFYVCGPSTKQIVLLHLSIENNRPSLALQEFNRVFSVDLKKRDIKIDCAHPEKVTRFKW